MRGDVDLKDINLQKLRLSRGQTVSLGIALLVLVGLWLGWRQINNPPRPWLVRWTLDRYLRSESHARTFQVAFPFPTAAEMAAPKDRSEDSPVKGSRTGKEFEPLREEYLALKTAAVKLEREVVRTGNQTQDLTNRLARLHAELTEAQTQANATGRVAKLQETIKGLEERQAQASVRRADWQRQEEALVPMVDDLWDLQKLLNAGSAGDASELARARDELLRSSQQKLEAASSYEAMYRIIGEELFVARGLLKSQNPIHQKLALNIAQAAARHAITFAMNGQVAGRIAEGYLLPHLHLATDANPRSPFSPQSYLDQCAGFFRQNNEFNNVVRTYELALQKAVTPARADWARAQMAGGYQQAGDIDRALATVREIKDSNTYRGLIRNLERNAQNAGR